MAVVVKAYILRNAHCLSGRRNMFRFAPEPVATQRSLDSVIGDFESAVAVGGKQTELQPGRIAHGFSHRRASE